MKRIGVIILVGCLAAPAGAQDTDEAQSLIERGAQLFLEGLRREMEPALEGLSDLGPALRGFAEEMGPALGQIFDQVRDWSAYHPPEILPNGDIIIRRKDSEKTTNEQPDGQIDL